MVPINEAAFVGLNALLSVPPSPSSSSSSSDAENEGRNGFLEQYSTYVCRSRTVQRGRLIWVSGMEGGGGRGKKQTKDDN